MPEKVLKSGWFYKDIKDGATGFLVKIWLHLVYGWGTESRYAIPLGNMTMGPTHAYTNPLMLAMKIVRHIRVGNFVYISSWKYYITFGWRDIG
ncbi:hypothetical protein RRF57_008016 [Xylaria bambusicola]|uniref:Uncharacterized protein n=1 Tax=Xylaria bambusicola TaxID=326684 RepID=A0AAN7Z7X6_9PEZI